ncbi:hypothetical protein JOE63_002593 [Cellulosimicrobium cellulans]|nr:hypothetical protein [Cellulosimicrobium cellulans]
MDGLDAHDVDRPEAKALTDQFEKVVLLAKAAAFEEGTQACADDDRGQHRDSMGAYNAYPRLLLRTRRCGWKSRRATSSWSPRPTARSGAVRGAHSYGGPGTIRR